MYCKSKRLKEEKIELVPKEEQYNRIYIYEVEE
jgi:hypothetical protein